MNYLVNKIMAVIIIIIILISLIRNNFVCQYNIITYINKQSKMC